MSQYSKGAVFLHWVIAAALVAELALGLGMPKDAGGFALIQLHKSLGLTILALSVLRLAWRLAHPLPASLQTGITHIAARAVHFGFYGVLILAPLSGWVLVSTSAQRIPTVLFGLIKIPDLPLSAGLNSSSEITHEALAWMGLGLFLTHIAGVLRHEVKGSDGTLARMSPAHNRSVGAALGIGITVMAGSVYLAVSQGAFSRAERRPPADLSNTELTPPMAIETQPSGPAAAQSDAPGETAIPHWAISPGSRLAFSVANGSSGTINGYFAKWRGDISFDPDRPETADIRIDVDLASATVGDATQDSMLAGADFFDVAGNATAIFRTTKVRAAGDGRYSATGTLEMKGMRATQAMTFRLTGNDLHRKVVGSASISRADFGIGNSAAGSELSPRVSLTFSFAATGSVSE